MRTTLTIGLAASLLLGAPTVSAPAALRAPTGQSPAAGATVDAPPLIAWRAVRGAAQYEVQVAADRNFGSSVLGRRGGALKTRNTAASIDEALADGTYYWRVRAVSAKGSAGRWTPSRSFTKSWSVAPQLRGPADELSVSWPSLPLVLDWSAVPRAAKYHVVVATDPSLAQPVVGTATKPVETQGTVFAVPTTLPAGRYYWAVTPVDAGNFKGRQSRIGSFTWQWPTRTSLRAEDVNDSAQVFDPRLAWDAVPGAAAYEVEVNPTAEFTLGSRVLSERTVSTSLIPRAALPNNDYHWRVRAIDPSGNAGTWNVGPRFTKRFDPVAPTVPNFRVQDGWQGATAAGNLETDEPLFTWDPVPGASGYELQVAPYESTVCKWGDSRTVIQRTPNLGWAPNASPSARPPGPESWRSLVAPRPNVAFVDGLSYCARILAFSEEAILSEWTTRSDALTYRTYEPASVGCPAARMRPEDYLTPQQGQFSPRTPVFGWRPVASAGSYWVVVAKDPGFTNVVDIGFTRIPVYVPPVKTLTDETTSYYWAVLPAGQADGNCAELPEANSPRSFEKRSGPPERLSPAEGSDQLDQPVFRWSPAEGARRYILQVASDDTFADPIETVETSATGYVPSGVYPVDTVLYWRVRATDRNRIALNWSTTGTFRRRLAVPTPASDNATSGSTIPVLAWAPVTGALSYGVRVDEADGDVKDFTVPASAFTPTQWYGTGVWRWKVRANFPGGGRTVSGGYSAGQEYVRRMLAPTGAKAHRSPGRLSFSWDPDQAATKYRVEISSSDSFDRMVETVTTTNATMAPRMSHRGYVDGGRLWWRVASMDSGNNTGAFASGIVALPKGMRLTVKGRPRRGVPSRLTVTVRSARGHRLRGATVTLRGAGMKLRRKTGKRGSASFKVRPSRRGSVVVQVTRRGFTTGEKRLRVR